MDSFECARALEQEKDEVARLSTKVERCRIVLEYVKTYMEREPQNETTANVLEMVNGVLESEDYVP